MKQENQIEKFQDMNKDNSSSTDLSTLDMPKTGTYGIKSDELNYGLKPANYEIQKAEKPSEKVNSKKSEEELFKEIFAEKYRKIKENSEYFKPSDNTSQTTDNINGSSNNKLNYTISENNISNNIHNNNLIIISFSLIIFCALCILWVKLNNK